MSSRDGNFYTKFRNEIAAGGATEASQNQNNKFTTAATSIIVVGLLAWLGVKNPWSLVFVAGLIVSVFLHEVGHFWTARRSGMKVTQFYMGMGPRVFSFQRGEVEFGLRALPVGAFVKSASDIAREKAEKAAEAAKPTWTWAPQPEATELLGAIRAEFGDAISQAYTITIKADRYARLGELKDQVVAKLSGEEGQPSSSEVKAAFGEIEYRTVRENIVNGKPRIDGRDTRTVRPLNIEVGVLPKTHGSALFTRGETQALVVATLGTARDAQLLDTLEGEKKDPFMLHYNFPPFSVGECGRMGGAGRREIGHGRLARRSVSAMLPAADVFPYTIRVVSEITESNGSSSMASVCGASLALMDAGVPMKAPVAGIAMGLVKEGEKFAVLTDILGDEDHLGDMDFKVAGTAKGVTALQMDIKIKGITEEIMEIALGQALEARLNILGQMNQIIGQSRTELSANAPTMIAMKIDTDKIRDVIGKGGATIRAICEETKASIDIEDDGSIKIFGETKEAAEAARQRILGITAEAEIGKIYVGKVERIVDFGAFVNILPGKDGLVHISMLSDARVEKVTDILKEGQEVEVLVLDVDNRGRIKLSIKDVAAAKASGV